MLDNTFSPAAIKRYYKNKAKKNAKPKPKPKGKTYAQQKRTEFMREGKVRQYKPDAFYDSRAWQELRYKALVLHGALCQCCGATRNDNVRIHVDHIKPRSRFPELQWDIDNLQVLCEPCNIGKGAGYLTDWR